MKKQPNRKGPTKRANRKITPKIVEVVERLELEYGRSRRVARFAPMDELISCILSQHTSDKSSFPAFTHLRATFPEWEDVANAPVEAVADAIRAAGLANQKAKSIIGCLQEIHRLNGDYSLEPLRSMPTLEARAWLMKLPGVGPKTASIVLCFSFGRETIPVDTHVFRVSKRLGILGERETENSSHDTLLELVPHDLAFRYHLALIQHGRNVCRAPVPACAACTVSDVCDWYKGRPG